MSVFNSADPLQACMAAADLAGLLDRLRAMSPAQRHSQRAMLLALRKAVDAVRWRGDGQVSHAQVDVFEAALLLCGTAEDAASLMLDDALLVSLCREFRPRALDGLVEATLARSPQRIVPVQALIAAGLAPRPDSVAYTLGLISLPWVLRDAARLQALLAADPGLAPALLRVMDIEGTADISLASSDKYCRMPGLDWATILLGLVERGVTTREALLLRTLDALANDWPQYRSGWFSRFHATLAPDAAAMRAHLSRYLALCHSRIPPTVGMALEALAGIDGHAPIEGATLLEALRPVLAGAVKAQIELALKLLDRVVQREPGLRATASLRAADGLMLDAAPLQKAILRRIEAWGADAAVRERLRSLGGGIAAVNRPAWQRLLGDDEAAPAAAPAEPAVAHTRRAHALDADRRIAAIDSVDALVEGVAFAFENDTDADAFERAVGGIVALAPFDALQRRTLAPVLKRAAKVRKPMAIALARLLLGVVEARDLPAEPGVDAGGNASPVQGVLLRRVDELIAFARQGAGVLPLSAPTHRRGFIAPAAMVERVAAHQARGVRAPLGEQVLGLLRLAPPADDATRERARQLADEPFTRALRHALGDDIVPGVETELFAAAARIRHPGADDERLLKHQGDQGPDAARAARYTWHVHSWDSTHSDQTYHFHDLIVQTAAAPADAPPQRLAVLRHPPPGDGRRHYRWWSFGGIDEGAIAWSATLLPSCPDAFFAEGARAVGNNLDWWEAQWQNVAYLRTLLDSSAPLGPMGHLLLALGLLGKEPGQTAMAVDALVQAHGDGRLEVARLAAMLAGLFATPMPKAARLRSSLVAATRADAALRGPAFELLAAVVTVNPPPREVATLLELMLEIQLGGSPLLPAASHDALARACFSGRARSLHKRLLAQGPSHVSPPTL